MTSPQTWTIDVLIQMRDHEDLEQLKGLSHWIVDAERNGIAVEREGDLSCQPREGFRYQGTFVFQDANQAMLFKLMFG